MDTCGCWDPDQGMATWVGIISGGYCGMTQVREGDESGPDVAIHRVSLVCNWAPPLGLTCTSVENNRLEKCLSILTPRRRLEGDQELKVISLSYIVNFSSVWGLRYMRPCLKTHACMRPRTHTHTCTHTHSFIILTMVKIKFQDHNQQ